MGIMADPTDDAEEKLLGVHPHLSTLGYDPELNSCVSLWVPNGS